MKNMEALNYLLREYIPSLPPLQGMVQPGYQQVSHNLTPHESQLCDDGADMKYSPGEEWKCRVWLGASMFFWHRNILLHTQAFRVEENFQECRILGNKDSEHTKAIVTIAKFYHPRSVYDNRKQETGGKLTADVTGSLVEMKRLCFMKRIPESLRSTDYADSQIIPPPTDPEKVMTMTPSKTLLFRFSALTQNAHAIHLNQEYARNVYGIPNLLVHGPLTSVLMLEFLRTGFHELRSGFGTSDPNYYVSSFEYKNHMPLWVDEKITIGCKRVQNTGSSTLANGIHDQEAWEVWISKGEGERATVAVKGIAKVGIIRTGDTAESQQRGKDQEHPGEISRTEDTDELQQHEKE